MLVVLTVTDTWAIHSVGCPWTSVETKKEHPVNTLYMILVYFSTVHRSTDLFHLPTLMHSSFIH